ncbi:MAG: hypothetical protein DELT_01683 [Desulfovibrio sp.]
MSYTHLEDKRICLACLNDEDLCGFSQGFVATEKCDYCGHENVEVVAIGGLAQYITECWSLEMDEAHNFVPYESREGGYLYPVYWTHDLVTGWDSPRETDTTIWTDEADLLEDLTELIGSDRVWAYLQSHYPEDGVHDVWSRFKQTLKHKARFMAFHPSLKKPGSPHFSMDIDTPLEELGIAIKQFEMLRIVPEGHIFYRTRSSENPEDFNSARLIGTPKVEFAVKANRMSPVGIPMFYGGFTPELCLAEIDYDSKTQYAHIAKFACLRPLLLVDFTALPRIPSLYSSNRELRPIARLVRSFAEEVSKPLIPSTEKVDHIEYIPTQAITEWLRYGFRVDGEKIDGVLYDSAKKKGTCGVLFFENEECIDSRIDQNRRSTPILELLSYERFTPKESVAL